MTPLGESDGGFARQLAESAEALQAWAVLRVGTRLRRRIDPEDVVQEVVCRAWRGFEGFDPERGSFRDWLFGIAHKVLQGMLLDLGRGGGPASIRSGLRERLLVELPDDATSISRQVARDESLNAFLERARAELTEEEQRLLIVRGLEGLAHEEVAELFGISAPAVRKRWERLRTRLVDLGSRDGLFLMD